MSHPANHSEATLELHLADERETLALAARIAPLLGPGMRVYLSGELGSGKTTLVRGMLRALGFSGRVKSPSYALVEPYTISSLYFYHFDFYRFHSEAEWTDAGFEELLDSGAICLVEWPERAGGLLPTPDVAIRFLPATAGRRVLIAAHSEAGGQCVSALRSRGASS